MFHVKYVSCKDLENQPTSEQPVDTSYITIFNAELTGFK